MRQLRPPETGVVTLRESATGILCLSRLRYASGTGLRPLAGRRRVVEPSALGTASNGIWLARIQRRSDALLLPGPRPACGISGRWRRSMTERYVELHAASAFSFLEGASQPEELDRAGSRAGDAGDGAARPQRCLRRRRASTPARNATASARMSERRLPYRASGNRLTPPAWLPHQHPAEPARLPLLCESRSGYQNLCQLITQFKMREGSKCEGAATFDDLQQYSAGLVCLTGGDEGPLAAALVQRRRRSRARDGRTAGAHLRTETVFTSKCSVTEREEEWRNQAASESRAH